MTANDTLGGVEALHRFIRDAIAAGLDPREVLLSTPEQSLLNIARIPRRFDRDICERLLREAAGDVPPATLDALITAELVTPIAGRPGWFRATRPAAQPPFDPGAVEMPWTPGGARWRALHEALASHFSGLGTDGEVEALFHSLSSQKSRVQRDWINFFEHARDHFDLAKCETLLRILDDCSEFITADLITLASRERGLLAARAAFADDFARTSRYLHRQSVEQMLVALLDPAEPFILQLHAPGGSGKTMFLRWLGPRFCLPKGWPVARIDFDFLDASERGLATPFLMGKLAERLHTQVPGLPFFELLRDLAEERRRALASPGAFDAAVVARLQNEVIERMAGVLAERCTDVPVLLIFDTVEDAALQHHVDLRALVQAVVDLRQRMASRVARMTPLAQHFKTPRLMLILSGRYPLDEQHPDLFQEFGNHIRIREVPPFDRDEALDYLRRRVAEPLTAPALLDAAIDRSGGNPFKLSLYADILLTSPDVTVEELGQGVEVDMLYLIHRILVRLKDAPLQWLLRYGVLARRLTRDFVEHVLLPPMLRSLRGDRRDDDPRQDGVRHARWPAFWETPSESSPRDLDVDKLWHRLRGYASASSWISVDAATLDAVVIQPVASQPMRRALLRVDRDVVRRIHRAAIAHASRSPGRPDALADLTYHEFLLNGPKAGRAWWDRLRKQRALHGDGEAVLSLASVVLSEDLKEADVPNLPGRPGMVDIVTQARALHALAGVHAARARAASDALSKVVHEGRAHDALARHDALVLASGAAPAIDALHDARLRLQLTGIAPMSRDRALAAMNAALKTRVDPATRDDLLHELQVAWEDVDEAQARSFARRRLDLARRRRDAPTYSHCVVAEVRARNSAGRPASALKLLEKAMSELIATHHEAVFVDVQDALERLELEKPDVLGAAGRWEEALELHLAVSQRNPSNFLDPVGAPGTARGRIGALLGAGRLDEALRLSDATAAIGPGAELQRKSGAWETMPLLERAEAARQAIEIDLMLDALSSALARCSELQDHLAEVDIRLQLARAYLFDIGDLKLAAEHLRDDDTALQNEPLRLQIKHALLRSALAALTKRPEQADVAFKQAVGWSCRLPCRGASQAVLLSLHGLRFAPIADSARHATALADTWARFDSPGARLQSAQGLASIDMLSGLTAALKARLERQTRLAPTVLNKMLLPDAMHLMSRRIDILRLIGRSDLAGQELKALNGRLHEPAQIFRSRELALAWSRLDLTDHVLDEQHDLARIARALPYPRLAQATWLEAAERAELHGDRVAAIRLANHIASQGSANVSGQATIWDLRRLELLARLAVDSGAANEALRLAQKLGWPARHRLRETEPSRLRTLPIEPQGVVVLPETSAPRMTLTHMVDGGHRKHRHFTPVGPLAAILAKLGRQRFGDAAAAMLEALLSPLDPDFGRILADNALPPVLVNRMQDALDHGLLAQELAIEHDEVSLHAMPWELMMPNLRTVDKALQLDMPITISGAVDCFWRAPALFSHRLRNRWVQQRLGLPVDGVLATGTFAALEALQRDLGLQPSSRLDHATLERIVDLYESSKPAARRVLLITPDRETQRNNQRGASAYGNGPEQVFRQAGLDVHVLNEPDAGQLGKLAQQRFDIVHMNAPIAQSRSSGELTLQFSSKYASAHATSFSPSFLGRALHASSLVILESTWPGSRDETVRQLLLRNAFAAQLFERGEMGNVVACGLSPQPSQERISDVLAEGLRIDRTAASLLRRIRKFDLPLRPDSRSSDLLGTAGVALFSRDPYIPFAATAGLSP